MSGDKTKKKTPRPIPVARPISAKPSQALRRKAEEREKEEREREEKEREEREREEKEREERERKVQAEKEVQKQASQTDGDLSGETVEGGGGESHQNSTATPSANGTPSHSKKTLPVRVIQCMYIICFY